MASTKRLRSVAHSVLHHALSGLSYVNPHLGEYCKSVGRSQIVVDLLSPSFDPPIAKPSREIALSTDALRQKFAAILASEQISLDEVARAHIVFYYAGSERWPAAGHIEVETVRGVLVQDTIDPCGRPAELLHVGGGST